MANGLTAHYYHGGLGNQERDLRFNDWMADRVQIMVATTAFGMGIDKSDVQTIVHVELPESIESYFQEAGRAGRNGNAAGSIILHEPGDVVRLQNQFIKVLPDIKMVKLVYKKLNSYFQVSYGEGDQAYFRFDFMDFCQTYGFNTLITYNVLQQLDRNSIILLTPEFYRKASLQIKVSPVNLTYYLIKNPNAEKIVNSILRTYGGIFDQEMTIDHSVVAKKSGETAGRVHQMLLQLEKDDLIIYTHNNFDTAITFLVPREDDHVINTIAKDIKIQNSRKKERVQGLLDYVRNDQTCRNMQLLAYFGEEQKKECGICDVCLGRKKDHMKNDKGLPDQIMAILQKKPLSSRAICEQLNEYSEQKILDQIRLLLELNQLKLTENNTYSLKK